MSTARIDQKAPGRCQPFRLKSPNGPRSTPYHVKKLKISSSTPLTAVIDLAGVNFLRSTDPPSLAGCGALTRGTSAI